MTDDQVFKVKIGDAIDRCFDDSSIPVDGKPELAIIMGGVAVGKTTLRNLHFAGGYVPLDAGDIFVDISQGNYFPFPGPLEEALVVIGNCVATQAIAERRNIVMELIGMDQNSLHELIDTMKRLDYRVSGQSITCDNETAQQRNLARDNDNISCYYAEPYHLQWLLAAARNSLAHEMA